MPNNGDIIKFVKQKDYVMVNNDLGSGSFGKTVLLKDPFIDELFVAKKYDPEYPDMKQEFFQSFLQEIKILYKLNHRNIVRIFNYYAYESIYTGYILMEYVEGKNIEEYFNDYVPWGDDTRAPDDIFSQLIDGFRYIEKNMIIHRDIRESNILIDASGTVKIIDFGLGKIFKPVERKLDSKGTLINRSGLDKLPNEYYTGTYDTKTDMFYLAELFNRMLYSSNSDYLFSHQQILNRMMEIKPENRFESFEEIAEVIGKKDFSKLEILDEDRRIYQEFSMTIYNQLSSYIKEKRFNYSVDEFKTRINDLIKTNCFEDYILNCSDLISTVVLSDFSYNQNNWIELNIVKRFYAWFSSLSFSSQQLVLNNIILKISRVKVDIADEEAPF